MKFFLILLLLGLVVFLLGMKHARPAQTKAPKPSAPGTPAEPAEPDTAPQTMLSCAQCGLHLPRDEALPGKGGVFCSAAHRAAFEAGRRPSGA